MKKQELKNCPNCNEKIGVHDIQCPYCKYIDDPKYKKYNEKLKKSKKKPKKKKEEFNLYKILLLIPVLTYLFYLFLLNNLNIIVISLILLNLISLFTKKKYIIILIFIEICTLLVNFITNIYIYFTSVDKDANIGFIEFVFGIVFLLFPKIIYLLKTIKKKKKIRKK